MGELEARREYNGNGLVFGQREAKNAFYKALRDAGIEDLRFHDLRGTAITRLLRAGMPATEVMKISGHSEFKTFLRYVKLDDDTIDRARTALDSYLENFKYISSPKGYLKGYAK